MGAAFFDVDHTIIPGISVERLFFRYLRAHGVISLRDVTGTIAFILRGSLDLSGMAMRSRRIYLAGKSIPLIEQMASRCFEEVIRPRISEDARDRILFHQEQGHPVVLITGSLDLLVRQLGDHLKVSGFIASDTERDEGHFSGRIRFPIPHGKGKEYWLKKYAADHGVDLRTSYAYGDSPADRWVLSLVGRPRVVNPGWRMRRIARRQGWEMLRWG
jgi:HAD superfamily hydrolase (TIGR01490 family)